MKNYYYVPELKDKCDYLRDFYWYIEENKNKLPIVQRPFAYLFDKDLLGIDMGDMFSDKVRFIFTTKSLPKLSPHIDSSMNGLIPGVINFPIINCDNNSITRWWKITKGEPNKVLNAGGSVEGSANYTYNCDNCELEMIDEVSFQNDEVHLFNTSQWHSVDNDSGKPRIVFSFLFKSNFKWEDIVKEYRRL